MPGLAGWRGRRGAALGAPRSRGGLCGVTLVSMAKRTCSLPALRTSAKRVTPGAGMRAPSLGLLLR